MFRPYDRVITRSYTSLGMIPNKAGFQRQLFALPGSRTRPSSTRALRQHLCWVLFLDLLEILPPVICIYLKSPSAFSILTESTRLFQRGKFIWLWWKCVFLIRINKGCDNSSSRAHNKNLLTWSSGIGLSIEGLAGSPSAVEEGLAQGSHRRTPVAIPQGDKITARRV